MATKKNKKRASAKKSAARPAPKAAAASKHPDGSVSVYFANGMKGIYGERAVRDRMHYYSQHAVRIVDNATGKTIFARRD